MQTDLAISTILNHLCMANHQHSRTAIGVLTGLRELHSPILKEHTNPISYDMGTKSTPTYNWHPNMVRAHKLVID